MKLTKHTLDGYPTIKLIIVNISPGVTLWTFKFIHGEAIQRHNL